MINVIHVICPRKLLKQICIASYPGTCLEEFHDHAMYDLGTPKDEKIRKF